MESRNENGPSYAKFSHPLFEQPYLMPDLTTQKKFDEALTYEAETGDIFLCTYPKCGTTWMQNILYEMKYGKTIDKDRKMPDFFPHLEINGLSAVAAIKDAPRLIKTHLLPEMTPWNKQAKYICVARNPKDCFTSFFHHTIGFKKAYNYEQGKFEDYFELLIAGQVDSMDYFDFTAKWWKRSKKESNVIFILYEDMKDNSQRELLRIAEFLGDDWLAKVQVNDNQLLNKIVDSSSFENMSKRSNQYHIGERPKEIPFVRKGVIGDWKNLLNKSQSDRVDEKLQRYGIKYPGFDKLWDKYAEKLE